MTSGDQKTGAGAALVAEETGVTKPQTLRGGLGPHALPKNLRLSEM